MDWTKAQRRGAFSHFIFVWITFSCYINLPQCEHCNREIRQVLHQNMEGMKNKTKTHSQCCRTTAPLSAESNWAAQKFIQGMFVKSKTHTRRHGKKQHPSHFQQPWKGTRHWRKQRNQSANEQGGEREGKQGRQKRRAQEQGTNVWLSCDHWTQAIYSSARALII